MIPKELHPFGQSDVDSDLLTHVTDASADTILALSSGSLAGFHLQADGITSLFGAPFEPQYTAPAANVPALNESNPFAPSPVLGVPSATSLGSGANAPDAREISNVDNDSLPGTLVTSAAATGGTISSAGSNGAAGVSDAGVPAILPNPGTSSLSFQPLIPPVADLSAQSPSTVMTFGDLGQAPASLVQVNTPAPSAALSGGLSINITYDPSVANAPAAFKSVVQSVVQFYESQFSNPITLNIDVGWGEVDGQTLGSGALGESESFIESFSYSQIKNALAANAASGAQQSAVASLPSSAPVNGTFYLTLADATALGLASGSATLDGYVGFDSSATWAYSESSGIPSGAYDLYGVVAHEISEVMGRISMLDSSGSYSDFDLFRYSASGTRSFVGSHTAYFSDNGGVSALNYFNSNPNGDFGDWAASAGNDSFNAFSNSGVVNPITSADLTVINVLGYNTGSSSVQPPAITALVESPSTGDLKPGKSVTLTLDFNSAVTVAGGIPTLTLNDGGTATYSSGSGTAALIFTYAVGASDSNVASLAATSINLNGGTISNAAGNAQLSLSGLTQSGPQIDTTAPAVSSIVESPSSGIENVGGVVVFKLDFTEAVSVAGAPTLTLNDGGAATYTSGTGGNIVTFTYTVTPSDTSVAMLAATAINLNGGSIEDNAGNNANIALSALNQNGPQIGSPAASEAQIDLIYQAVLQRAPTSAETTSWAVAEPPASEAAVISSVVRSAEAQFNIYSVIQVIELATGVSPTTAQLNGWVHYIESHGLLQGQAQTSPLMDQMATAFVASTIFANTYNNGVAVDPNSAVTPTIMQAIIHNALGTTPTATQINNWVSTGLSVDQAFVDFALGDQYTALSQSSNQQFLTSLADSAVMANGGTIASGTAASDSAQSSVAIAAAVSASGVHPGSAHGIRSVNSDELIKIIGQADGVHSGVQHFMF